MNTLEQHFGLIVFLHVTAAHIFAFTLVIMQYAIGPALAKLPPSSEKDAAVQFLHSRWHPVVDTAIIVLAVTGSLLMALRWKLIGLSPLMHFKTSFGIIALGCAILLHFYFRGYKRRLKEAGNTEKLKDINRLTGYLEKTALVFGVAAWASGILFNHFPF